MSDDRPSDALQPSSKRRAAAQVTKDDPDDDEEDVQDPGAWKPVDAEVTKRRKVKARRAGGVEPDPVAEGAPASTGNPFAGIALAAPSGANPFSGFNLVPPAAAQDTSSAQLDKAGDAAAAAAAAAAALAPAAGDEAAAPKPAEDPKQAADAKDAKDAKEAGSVTPGFGSFAAGSNPFAALTSSSKSGGGFGGFGSFNAPQASKANETPTATPTFTPLFGATPKGSGFSFGTTAFPNIAATPKTGSAAEDGDEADEANVELFNDSTAEFKPVMQLPDQKTVTGEEEESVVFTADGTLYEFEPNTSKWRERGKGEFRLNLDKAGQARMVMRQTGNYRLLMNAKVYSGMAVQKMSGDVGVTFACANIAPAADQAPDKKEASPASGTPGSESVCKVATWALKIKSKELVGRLYDMLGQHKAAAPSSAS